MEEEQSNTETTKQKDIELENLKRTELSLNDDVRISLNGKDISLTYLAYNYTKDWQLLHLMLSQTTLLLK